MSGSALVKLSELTDTGLFDAGATLYVVRGGTSLSMAAGTLKDGVFSQFDTGNSQGVVNTLVGDTGSLNTIKDNVFNQFDTGNSQGVASVIAGDTGSSNTVVSTAAVQAAGALMTSDLGLQTIWIPAGAFTLDGTTPPAVAVVDSTVNYAVLDFDASSDESVWFTIALPKNHDDGTLTYRVFWTTANTGTEGVAWALRADADTDNDAIEIGGTPVVVTDDNQSAAGDLLVTSWSTAVTIADSVADGDLTVFELYRDVSNANDDMTEDARLIGIQIRYNTDALKDD